MGRRGPPAKPTALKILQGNPGEKKLPEHEAHPTVGIPECPAIIKGLARKEWDRITPQLANLGLITDLDKTAIVAYCLAYGKWYQLEDDLLAEGLMRGNVQNPKVVLAEKAWTQLSKMLQEFGLTPAARSRVNAIKTDKKSAKSAKKFEYKTREA